MRKAQQKGLKTDMLYLLFALMLGAAQSQPAIDVLTIDLAGHITVLQSQDVVAALMRDSVT